MTDQPETTAQRHVREREERATRRRAAQTREAAARRLPRGKDEGKRQWDGHAE